MSRNTSFPAPLVTGPIVNPAFPSSVDNFDAPFVTLVALATITTAPAVTIVVVVGSGTVVVGASVVVGAAVVVGASVVVGATVVVLAMVVGVAAEVATTVPGAVTAAPLVDGSSTTPELEVEADVTADELLDWWRLAVHADVIELRAIVMMTSRLLVLCMRDSTPRDGPQPAEDGPTKQVTRRTVAEL